MSICFALLTPLAGALSDNDKTTIESSAKPYIDNGLVKRVDVIVQPPDGIMFNIIPNSTSNEDLAMADVVGVSLFSMPTGYHPEVTTGTISLIWDVPTGGSKVTFLTIYQSDLGPITDRKNPTKSEVMQVADIITERAKQEKPKATNNENELGSPLDVVALKEGDGLQIYFALLDNSGQLTSSDGVLRWYITELNNYIVSPIQDQYFTTEIKSTQFQNTTIGVGNSVHKGLIYNIGHVPSYPQAEKVYVVFRELPSGREHHGATTIPA